MNMNMRCQIKNHYEKEIIAFCLDKNCKNKRFCCIICMKDHYGHPNKLIEVSQFNTFIEQEKNKQIQHPQAHSYGQQQIIQGLEKLMNYINFLKKIIKEKIEKIKQQNLQNYLKQTSNSQQGIEYWNQLLEGILQYVEVDNCVINVTKSKEGQLKLQEQIEIENIKQSEQSLISMIDHIQQTQIKIGKFCFKEDRKHADLSVIDECIVKKTKGGSFAMAYANEGFDPSSQTYAFAFNIQNLASGYSIFVGVGNDEGIKASSYIFNNYTQLGHGQYMIYNCGTQTIHHTDGDYSWKNKGITFKTGVKIQIKYSHVTKLLEFRKSSEQNTVVQMPITDMKKRLYPCVMVYGSNDQVQLVEY